MSDTAKSVSDCPVCNKSFPANEIEAHANKCIFLNSKEESLKRKRTPSPGGGNPTVQLKLDGSKSPKDNTPGLEEEVATILKKRNGETDPNLIPLAKQMQPKTLEEFVGQSHVLAKTTVLYNLLLKEIVPNMILWGPPGSGKTSLAGIIEELCNQNPTKYRFVSLCASTHGTKDVQKVVELGISDLKNNRKLVLFMDEIHRFSKRQQDVFLTHVEKGEIVLIGATTENPSFALNNALLSRCRVLVFEKLESDDILNILRRAAEKLKFDIYDCESSTEIKPNSVAFELAALKWIADISDGDARIALNNLELILRVKNHEGKLITLFDIKGDLKKSHFLYDRKGDEHYNTISALHKSIRGSDPNAALYWATRMMMSGEDPLYIARRLIRIASEDIGDADPQALHIAVDTMQACKFIGMPEADVNIAQCVVYLAKAKKSRNIDNALAKVKQAISTHQGAQPSVPLHLRNAPNQFLKSIGAGSQKGQTGFLPPELKGVKFL